MTRVALSLCLMQCLAMAAETHAAPVYPSRPIRIVNPYAPGGITDLVSRVLAQRVAEAWGQPVIVDNRPGAGSAVGTEIVVRAQPDGYTLLCTTPAVVINPSFYPKLGLNPVKDLVPVVLVARVDTAFAVHPGVTARSVKELIALARAKPGQIFFASAGTGTSTHLSLELFKTMAGVDLPHVPYKGGGPALIDVVGGQVQGIVNPLAGVLPHARTGRLRALAVTGAKRSELAADLPTIAEAGVPGYDATAWSALFAPRATAPAIVEKWNSETNRVLGIPEVRQSLLAAGMTPIGGTAQEFAPYFAREAVRWPELVRTAGITVGQ